ncbi:MAG: helicase [Calditrichaeota bacterium]|nr:MAG: helicase [Calditrichota bacterium]
MALKIEKYLSPETCAQIQQEIADAENNEVFFIGKSNEKKIVDEVAVMARGNKTAVPAIIANCKKGDILIHNHPSGNLSPSAADNSIASQVGNDGIGFYIVNNQADEIYVVVEPASFEELQKVDVAKLQEFLDDSGPLSHHLDNYEKRAPQLAMLAAVANAFNDEKIAMIEAGTGTGKTLAYLLPAIAWALANGKRIVVSTNTINLQQQLIDKDIPLLQSIYPEKFRAELVKGRSNYICLRKLNDLVNKPASFDFDGSADEIEKLWKWAQKTRDGSRADLQRPPNQQLWESIQSESDTTLKKRCPFFHKCFFYNARRRASTADVLVVNHHLLFADISVRSAIGSASEVAVLPNYDRVILDEAHNLEDIASRYFGVIVTHLGMLRMLNRLHRVKGKKATGLFASLAFSLNKLANKIPADLQKELYDLVNNDAIECLTKVREQLHAVTERVFYWTLKTENSSFKEVKVRLTEEIRSSQEWQDTIEGIPFLIKFLHELAEVIQKIIPRILKAKLAFGEESLSLVVDLKAQVDRIIGTTRDLNTAVLQDDELNVRWIEAKDSRFGQIVRFCTAPIEIAPILKNAVFDKIQTVIMTSATMAIGGDFKYFSHRFGLDMLKPEKCLFKLLASPFDFKKQAMICIPTDIAEPNENSFTAQLRDYLLQAIVSAHGNTFALFTSYFLMNQMYEDLSLQLGQKGMPLLKQGDQSRHLLLNRFRTENGSSLFGTDSFWEGVDVQGKALVQVIIPRLPFRVPNEPIIEARVEAIEAAGGNSFMEYSVPQAVLKFKQGFGRLIRTKTDTGVILVLDKRIISKYYGKLFLASLPNCKVVVGKGSELFNEISRFLEGQQKS